MKYFGTITDPKDLVNKEYIDDVADTKANIDGAYENMTVGNAEQLVSTVMVNDQEPYTFRTSGGSADIGDREYDTLVGGTLAWNQLVQNGNFASTSGWTVNNGTLSVTSNIGTYAITAIAGNTYENRIYRSTGFTPILNHKYYITGDVLAPYTNTCSFLFANMYCSGAPVANVWTRFSKVGSATGTLTSTNFYCFVDCTTNYAVGDTIQYRNVQLIDLTQMFGTEIADYIYSLETTTPGSGVAYMTKLFPKLNGGYYEYCAPTLKSVSGVSAHNMTGLNQWDEVWELGSIDTATGNNSTSSTSIRSKNYIPVIPGASYFFGKYPIRIYGYDVNKNYLRSADLTANTATDVWTDAYYIRFRIGTTQSPVTTYNNDICINLHWDGERDGEYEPYKLTSYPLDSSLTLRGIPKLDANNVLYYDGDTYAADGTVTRRYGIVDLGTLIWNYQTEQTRFIAHIASMKDVASWNSIGFISSAKYTVDVVTTNDNVIGVNANNIYIRDTSYSDAATFKTAMSGFYLVYELATPTTEAADPYQTPQIVDDFGTEEYVTAEQGDVKIPVGHNTNYANNLRAKLEMAPESPSGDGDYIVRQTSGQNAYVPLVFPVSDLPAVPTTDGTYNLQVSVADGTATYSWVSV